MEMQQLMLSYPEAHTDLVFEVISTHPLEYRAGVERTPKKKDDNVQPGIIIGNISDYVRKDKKLPDWRQHSDSDLLMSQGIFESPISIDKITKFSLRPLELRSLIDQVGNYYRCFFHGKKTFNEVEMRSKIHYHVQKTMWIDGLRKQIKFRRNDIHELMVYLREIEIPKSNRHASHIMFNVFEKIERLNKVAMSNGDFMNQRDHDDWNFISSEIIYDDKKMKLPIPVYSYIKPHMGTNFLLHILLSLGHFETELDLILRQNIKESFRYAKLIGKKDDEESLVKYSNDLLRLYIKKQLVYASITKYQADIWIATAGELFDSVIIRNEIPITDMPPALQTSLEESKLDSVIEFLHNMRKNIISSAMMEFGNSHNLYNIPSKEELYQCRRYDPLSWDAMQSFKKSPLQCEESYKEQKLAIESIVSAIEQYLNPIQLSIFVKCRVIAGAPGSGKSFILNYTAIYAISKGLVVGVTAMMAKRAIAMGGIHLHLLFKIPVNEKLTLHRLAEASLLALSKFPERL